MVDSYTFALAQQMVWVNHLLDDNYSSLWKTIEVAALADFHCDVDILWKSYAPESLLGKLKNNQLADSIRTWYIYRAKAVKDLFDFDTEDFSSQEYLWFNRRVRSKSKQYFDYQDWYDKGIHTIADLMNVPDPDDVYIKTLEDLVSEFGISRISQKDKRKHNFLLKNIPSDWLDKPGFLNFNS